MARVLLIKIRMPRMARFGIAASPPLGILNLAAYSRQQRPGKDEFMLIDERVHDQNEISYEGIIRDFKPDVIGLSVLTTEAERMREIGPWFKRLAPNALLFAGGPHATAYGAKLFAEAPLDFIFRGESEVPFVKLLDALDRGDRFPAEKLSGVMYHRPDGTLYEVPYNVQQPVVEELPTPAWDLLNFDDYEGRPRMTPINTARYAPLFTSRGCPYRCIYCHDVFKKGFRAQSPMKAVDEIEHLIRRYNVNDFEIYDDIFNADYDRTMEICREIKRRGLKTRFTFPNGIRGDRLDKPLIEALASVGTYHMAFAIESANPRVQKLIRKHIKLDVIQENIGYAADAGIFAWGFFMLGFPTETREEIWRTVRFAVESRLHGAFFFQVVPFGGTELAEKYYSDAPPMPGDMAGADMSQIPLEEITGTNSIPQEGSLSGDYHFTTNSLSEVGPLELSFIQRMAYINFYYHPKRMYRIFRDYPVGVNQLVHRATKLTRYLVYEKPLMSAKRAFTRRLTSIAGAAA